MNAIFKSIRILALGLSLGMPVPIATAEGGSPSLPAEAERNIEALLEIKREAMRWPGMRSRSENEFGGFDGFGVLGKRAEALMDELAEWVADPAFVAELREAEAGDIRAKIALWAVDRQDRPEE